SDSDHGAMHTRRAEVAVPPPAALAVYRRIWQLILRHPVLTVAILAFTIRMVVAAGLRLLGVNDLVEDDQIYVEIVRAKVNGTLGSLDAFHQDLYSSTWVFTTPLTLIGRVFGVHVLAGEVVIALWATLTAVATTLIALRTLARRGLALLAGLVPALLPSPLLWPSVWVEDA